MCIKCSWGCHRNIVTAVRIWEEHWETSSKSLQKKIWWVFQSKKAVWERQHYLVTQLTLLAPEWLSIVSGVTLTVQMKLIDGCRYTMLKKSVWVEILGLPAVSSLLEAELSITESCYFTSQCVSTCSSEPFSPTIIWILLRIFTSQCLSPFPLWTSHRNILMDDKQFQFKMNLSSLSL